SPKTLLMLPLGVCTVTLQAAVPCVVTFASQTAGSNTPPIVLLTKKVKSVDWQSVVEVVEGVVVVVDVVVEVGGGVVVGVGVVVVVDVVVDVVEVVVVVVEVVEVVEVVVVLEEVVVVVGGRLVVLVMLVVVVVAGHDGMRGRHRRIYVSLSKRGFVPLTAVALAVARACPGLFLPEHTSPMQAPFGWRTCTMAAPASTSSLQTGPRSTAGGRRVTLGGL